MMYCQIKPTEVFRERELALLEEAKNRRLARRLHAGRTQKTRKIAGVVVGFMVALVVAGLMLVASSGSANATTTFLVNSTADQPDADTTDGKCFALNASCTLRAAIQQADATPGADVIEFSISGGEVHTITPSTPLPTITEQVTIDGYSQAGASPNTKTVGNDAVPKIELDGTNMPNTNGLRIFNSSGSVIRGLVINRFGVGIDIAGNSVGNRIEGNFIGTDPTGTIDRGNHFSGVEIFDGPSETVVGGSTPDKRNIISGNDENGGLFISSNSNDNFMEGNYVGTDKSGTKDLGNTGGGVLIQDSSGTTVGGKTVASRNVISGNDFHGLDISGSQRTKVLGNRIGTTASGTAALGNSSKGVLIELSSSKNLLGDGTSAGANTIAFNGLDGVEVRDVSTGNKISRNSIFSNGGLGIDLTGQGEGFFTDVSTPNDRLDTDAGPNRLQNFPVLSSAKTLSGKTTIKGKLKSNPDQTYTLQFFKNPKGNEGKTFLGRTSVTTDASGIAAFAFSPNKAVAVGKTITATATRSSTLDTSEFSTPRKVVSS